MTDQGDQNNVKPPARQRGREKDRKPGAPLKNTGHELVVRGVIEGKTITQATIDSGILKDPTNRIQAAKTGSIIMKKGHVRERFTELMAEYYPEFEQDMAKVVRRGVELAAREENLDKVSGFVDKMARLAGYQAPTKSQRLNASVSVPSLPSDGSEEEEEETDE